MKPIGLQLYTLRELLGESKESFYATMERVAKMGFKGVEGGIGQHDIAPKDYKKLLDNLGLEMITGPGVAMDLGNIDKIAEYMEIFGFEYLFGGFGHEEFKDLDAIKRTCDLVNKMTDAAKPISAKLALHNHWWEFEEIDGKLAVDYVAEACPDVYFELDVYWATNFEKCDAAEQVAKLKSRIPLLHIKDGMMTRKPDEPMGGPMSAVGKGKVNIAGSIAAADQDLLQWVIVEIDRCEGDRAEATEESIRFLVDNGLGAGNR